ncbi:MAG: glycosyltransferase family 9 protein [Candidatus Gastranaerophilales bacterium]|nr:glycosyltransferase family 9 protein [Candidatus Gastranaerophilales bacterium]
MHEEIFNQISSTFFLPKKTLIVFPDFIGDSVLLTPFLRNFRYNLSKGAVVHVCANTPIAQMLQGDPHIDMIFAKDKIRDIPGFLKRQKYDTALILDFSLSWSFHICKAKKIQQKVITDMKRANVRMHKFLGGFFNHVLETTTIEDKKPQIDVYLSYLKQLGLKVYDRYLEVKVDFNDVRNAQKLIKSNHKRKVFLHMGASIYSKQWKNSYWKQIINHLCDDDIYIIGSDIPSDELLASNVIDLCGKTNLKGTIALLKNADILITTDSAPAHLGAVAKVPKIIVLYGPTNNHQWKPYSPSSDVVQLYADVPCRPCNWRMCKGLKCIKELRPSYVIDAIESI